MNTCRRDFLKGCAAAATGFVGVGCGIIPGFGSLRRDDTLIAVLSDCHVGNWRSPDYQGVKLAECIARVLALDPLPAKMFILGDLAYLWGRREDYELSRRLLQPVLDAGIELTIGMGNHDRRENFLEIWPEYVGRSPVPGRIVSKVSGAYFDFIMADTLDQPKETDKWITPGTLDDVQREWLKAECAAARRPLLVMAHHPAGEFGPPGQGSFSARQFGELIMGTKDAPTRCCGYIHGHDHRWYVTRRLKHWSEKTIGQTACLPSTGHWGDIGYCLLREYADRAELSLVQYDYFSPKPAPEGSGSDPAWQAIVRDNAGSRCTFVARQPFSGGYGVRPGSDPYDTVGVAQ
ncbi:MAG: metallophosphoesterase [Kiritimatiellae bacterium]|nr:metallophosphoesterase [Kiritimatiellia bacterium]